MNLELGNNPIIEAINVDIKAGKGVNVIADANKLPFENASFDAIVSVSPFEYNPLTSDAFRILKEGGTFTIVGTYNNKYFKNVFNASEQELSSAGFGLLYKGKPVEGL
ncbi:class I SAM-dependent methyltransferase [Brevibacillus sp. FSL K6-0770]|uniref:methyltransferase domain-containing protein n=1 Tax=unclassified Brevibacillus TaxID=2684853 RepID=UPI00156BD75A|nr:MULTISPECIES: class I SAM-dependent methyltransferase [unclassified Brevibacillus]MDH6348689.1 SAM-dependent methyltransferase [Brevibacillus sp. 1238]NRQ55669.1 class I SAM-dependent methyltransferase [Brevibacillus sp. HD1.4A]